MIVCKSRTIIRMNTACFFIFASRSILLICKIIRVLVLFLVNIKHFSVWVNENMRFFCLTSMNYELMFFRCHFEPLSFFFSFLSFVQIISIACITKDKSGLVLIGYGKLLSPLQAGNLLLWNTYFTIASQKPCFSCMDHPNQKFNSHNFNQYLCSQYRNDTSDNVLTIHNKRNNHMLLSIWSSHDKSSVVTFTFIIWYKYMAASQRGVNPLNFYNLTHVYLTCS